MRSTSHIANPVPVSALAKAFNVHKTNAFRMLKRKGVKIEKVEWLTNSGVQVVSVIRRADADRLVRLRREIARRSGWHWRPPIGERK